MPPRAAGRSIRSLCPRASRPRAAAARATKRPSRRAGSSPPWPPSSGCSEVDARACAPDVAAPSSSGRPDQPCGRFTSKRRTTGSFLFFDEQLLARLERLVLDVPRAAVERSPTASRWPSGSRRATAARRRLWNVAYHRWLTWDGRADSLWMQALDPLEDPREMDATRTGRGPTRRARPGAARRRTRRCSADLDDHGRGSRSPGPSAPDPVRDTDDGAAARGRGLERALGGGARSRIDRVFVELGKALAAYQRRARSRRRALRSIRRGPTNGRRSGARGPGRLRAPGHGAVPRSRQLRALPQRTELQRRRVPQQLAADAPRWAAARPRSVLAAPRSSRRASSMRRAPTATTRRARTRAGCASCGPARRPGASSGLRACATSLGADALHAPGPARGPRRRARLLFDARGRVGSQPSPRAAPRPPRPDGLGSEADLRAFLAALEGADAARPSSWGRRSPPLLTSR